MADDQVARVGLPDHDIEQVAETLDVGIVQWCIDLIQHADRRRIGQEQAEDQSDGRQRLLSAR